MPGAADAELTAAARRLAGRWATALAGSGQVLEAGHGATDRLVPVAERLARLVCTQQPDSGLARDICAALLRRGTNTAAAIGPTVLVLVDGLAEELRDLPGWPGADIARVHGAPVAARVAELLAEATRAQTLAAQEEMQRAALAAVRAAERDRRTSEARFRALFSQAAAGIAVISSSGLVIDGNDTWSEQMGFPIEEMRGRAIAELVSPGSEPIALTRFEELLAGGRDAFRLEFGHIRRDGRAYVLDLSVSRVRAAGAEPDFLVGIAIDVTDRKRLEERLWHEARHDPLTGLPNRTMFFERLAALLATTPSVGVCYVDLDGFKSINDGLGHDVGDQVLVRVADRLGAVVTAPSSLLARLGGDEFGVITDGSIGEPAGAQAQRVLDALEPPITIGGRELSISASVGVVESAATPTTGVQELMRSADISLYQAKARGRGRLNLHDPRADAHHVTRHALATELAAALTRGEFFLQYQPLMSLADNTIRRVEALLRWRHPVLGPLGPDRFIEMAEVNGHIGQLGRWVLGTACRAAQEWNGRFPAARIGVNVNVAVGQLQDPQLPAQVAATLAETGLPAELLFVELTESAVLGEASGPVDALVGLAAAGVGLVIDDFGTGYSNLAHLTRLPVSELKIPPSFLPVTPAEVPGHDKILPAVISLAHSMGLRVTAEGVENAEQADLLRALSCDTAQGWYFGAPMSAAAIAELLGSESGRP